MQIERISFGIQSPELRITTYIYSLLSSLGVQSATALEIIASDGSGTLKDLHQALHKSASTSAVALVPVGGTDLESECQIMATHADVAYVFAQKGMKLKENPTCGAPNILLVAALNEDRSSLAYFSGSGPGYRIAAPARVSGKGPGGVPMTLTGMTPGATLTAAHLVRFRRSHTGLNGANLIQKFLEEATERVPALIGKVEEGRILKSVP